MRDQVSMDALGLLTDYGVPSLVHHAACRAKGLKLARSRSSRARFSQRMNRASQTGLAGCDTFSPMCSEKTDPPNYNIGVQGNTETEAISTPTGVSKVQMWSIQRREAWDELLRTGHLRASPQHIDPDFLRAYEWMATQLELAVPRSPSNRSRFPVWAWVQYDGVHCKKPKLSDRSLLPASSEGVLLEILVPRGLFLASDFQKWHAVLNNEFLPVDTHQQEQFDAWLKEIKMQGAPLSIAQAKIQESWHRVFDLSAEQTDCWGGPNTREIQAVLWQIDREMVKTVESFQSS